MVYSIQTGGIPKKCRLRIGNSSWVDGLSVIANEYQTTKESLLFIDRNLSSSLGELICGRAHNRLLVEVQSFSQQVRALRGKEPKYLVKKVVGVE